MSLRTTLPRSALAVLLTAACAGRATPGAGHADTSVITRDQIAAAHFTSAYDVVQSLHNNWLHNRGTDSFQSPGQVLVYLDDNRLGGVESLRAIASHTIGSIRFIDAPSATARWGPGHTQGVIAVVTQVGQ
ncbi:MAG TPA: hypothetical protein VGD56_11330 [Gemmatirosa sp.]